ncbi:hypothetical protein CEXT_151551 [Caerostris extrusa]|uniref:Uncharacterized protein n=1 Tax=Caerostris extrusa TaxID=172846 RepID=A0AAV4TQI9_CAEEX|nr:hypothetical protein CEXT_151551 [Caerostris extrusa]
MPNCYEHMCSLADEAENKIDIYYHHSCKAIRRYMSRTDITPMDTVFFTEYIGSKKIIFRAKIFKQFEKVLRAILKKGCNDAFCELHLPNGPSPFFFLLIEKKKRRGKKKMATSLGVF